MTLTILTPPAAEPVSVAEAKAHLRVTFSDEDALIAGLVTAARERVEADLGVCLITTGLRETGFASPVQPDGSVELARGPLIGVDAVSRIEADGSLTALAYTTAEVGSRPGRIALASGALPFIVGREAPPARLRVDYRAGFGPSPTDLPETLRQAVLTLAAAAYEHRGDPPATLVAAEPWLAPWRRLRL